MSTTREPPYDGKPCPMCPMGRRNLAAVAQNLLSAVDRRASACKITEKLGSLCSALASYNPVQPDPTQRPQHYEAELALCKLEQAAIHVCELWRISSDPDYWTLPLGYLRLAVEAVQPFMDAHFADPMHSHGMVARVAAALERD